MAHGGKPPQKDKTMSGHIENLSPVYRRAMRVVGCAATVAGTTNTQIINFTGTPAVVQGTALPIGTTLVAPVAASQNWLNVFGDAVLGTTFKVNRRGVYMARLSAVETAANVAAAQIGITVDCPAANLAVAAPLTDATVGLIDYTNILGVASSQVPGKTFGHIYITDALAGGAQPSATTAGVGVIRFHASNGVSAVVGAVYIVGTYRADIVYLNDIAG